jgi:hypothetical protein
MCCVDFIDVTWITVKDKMFKVEDTQLDIDTMIYSVYARRCDSDIGNFLIDNRFEFVEKR